MKLQTNPLRLVLAIIFCLAFSLQSTFAANDQYRIYAQVGSTKYYMKGEPTDGHIASTTDANRAMIYTMTKLPTGDWYYITFESNGETYYLSSTKNGTSYKVDMSTSKHSFERGKGYNGTYQFYPYVAPNYSLMYYVGSNNFQLKEYYNTTNNSTSYYDLNLEPVIDTPSPQTFDLTVSSAGYATLCLPFNADVPLGVELYTGSYVDGKVILVESQSGKVCANEGYIVRASEGSYRFTETNDNVERPTGNYFVGVTATQQLTGNDNIYIFGRKDGKVDFYRLVGSYTLGANKAYLNIEK